MREERGELGLSTGRAGGAIVDVGSDEDFNPVVVREKLGVIVDLSAVTELYGFDVVVVDGNIDVDIKLIEDDEPDLHDGARALNLFRLFPRDDEGSMFSASYSSLSLSASDMRRLVGGLNVTFLEGAAAWDSSEAFTSASALDARMPAPGRLISPCFQNISPCNRYDNQHCLHPCLFLCAFSFIQRSTRRKTQAATNTHTQHNTRPCTQ